MTEALAQSKSLVEALSDPGAFPDATASVTVRETHMSWVFLTDSRAYKLKKPLRYSYLDFRTAAARRLNCEREVRLNRRFTTDVYRGLAAVCRDGAGRPRLGPPRSDAEDWLVVMRRLDDTDTLEAGLQYGWARADQLTAPLRLLIDGYHRRPSPQLAPYDYVNRLWRRAEDNAAELRRPEFNLNPTPAGRLLQWVLTYLARHAGHLAGRARQGLLVEGHGDLRPEHIYLGESPRIVDCLEFNRDFRALDPVEELACLALHCRRLGGDWVSEALLERYAALTGDAAPRSLLALHMACRGLLWAKLAIWHLERSTEDAAHWRRRAEHYLAIAREEAERAGAD